jgi:uncharacterized membrane protein
MAKSKKKQEVMTTQEELDSLIQHWGELYQDATTLCKLIIEKGDSVPPDVTKRAHNLIGFMDSWCERNGI